MGLNRIKSKFPIVPGEKMFKTQGIDQESKHDISSPTGRIAKHLWREDPSERGIEEINDRKDPIPYMVQTFAHGGKVIE